MISFKSLLSEYGTIEDLMADLLENPIMGDPAMEEDVFGVAKWKKYTVNPHSTKRSLRRKKPFVKPAFLCMQISTSDSRS